MKQVTLKSVFTALWVLLIPCWYSLASAETFIVNTFQDPEGADCSSGLCSLRAAIQQANVLPNKDIIVLTEGTYNITLPGILEEAAAVGDFDITENLIIRGDGRSKTIINGNQIDRIFDIKNSASVEIDGVTIRNGFTNDASNGVIEWGGGAMLGGGISLSENSSLTLTNCILADNKTLTNGGAISSKDSNLIIDNCIIDNNTAASGGGISLSDSGTATISNSTFKSNNADFAAGLYNLIPSTTHTITSTVFYDNHADAASAIGSLAFGSVMYLNNSTVSGNTSDIHDSIYIFYNAKLYINNSTIVTNIGSTSAGIGNFGQVFIKNSIVATNTNNNGVSLDCSGNGINSSGYNIIGSNNGCSVLAATGDIIGTQTTPINPMLTPLTNNGGSTLTHALLPGSVAIDAGSTAVAGSGGSACEVQDQRGINRINGSRCDIGAYELASNADLSVVIAQATDVQTTTYILKMFARISNDGPNDANNPSLQITLPIGAEYQNSVADEWDCTAIANSITCERLLLFNTEKSDIEINFWPPNGVNPMVITASIESSTTDLNRSNNTSELIIDSEINAESDEDTETSANTDNNDPFAEDENNTVSETNNTTNTSDRYEASTTQNSNRKLYGESSHVWGEDIHAIGELEDIMSEGQRINNTVLDVSQYEKSWLTMDRITTEDDSIQSELFKLGAGAMLFAGVVTLYINPITFFGIFFSFPLWSLFDPTPVTLLSLSTRRQREHKGQKQRDSEDSSDSIGRILDDDTDVS